MSRACLALILVSCLRGQTPADYFDKAPPDVEDALRARITGFYQAHVDKKFRQAEQYVAEDTKDFFYEANKPAYLAFEIGKITYSDHYTKAKAIVLCKMRVMMPGFAQEPVTAPIPSTWKVENGQWYWYVDQKNGRETPFGVMKPQPNGAPASDGMSTVSAGMASGPSIASLLNSVGADKSAVQLSVKHPASEQVTISSKMPGSVSLQLEAPEIAGLDVKLDRTELKTGEQARLLFQSRPGDGAKAMTAEVRVRVMPINKVIAVRVSMQ